MKSFKKEKDESHDIKVFAEITMFNNNGEQVYFYSTKDEVNEQQNIDNSKK